MLNHTHKSELKSWVKSANDPNTDFPIQNLPYCLFSDDDGGTRRGGVGIGDMIVDLAVCDDAGLFSGRAADAAFMAAGHSLNDFMSMDPGHHSALRAELSDLLSGDGRSHRGKSLPEDLLKPMSEVTFHLPVQIGDYTDFYASIHHATNVGSMFRPDNPLLPNYKYVPIGYHGRSSSISLSDQIIRPSGQTKAPDAAEPSFGPSKQFDYEMEVGFFIGQGNQQGESISIEEAKKHIFGFCLVNDWSARDLQAWEYQPLGPFLAKNFSTTVSPWIITSEALAPFAAPAFKRAEGDPGPLHHLFDEHDQEEGGLDINLEVHIQSERMKSEGIEPMRISKGNFMDMYWTVAQMVTHHSSNGCNLRAGDLLASGTVSGTTVDSRGCLLERTWRGRDPIELPTGEKRSFLEDGDEIIMKGYCEREGAVRIGFGECRGTVVSASR